MKKSAAALLAVSLTASLPFWQVSFRAAAVDSQKAAQQTQTEQTQASGDTAGTAGTAASGQQQGTAASQQTGQTQQTAGNSGQTGGQAAQTTQDGQNSSANASSSQNQQVSEAAADSSQNQTQASAQTEKKEFTVTAKGALVYCENTGETVWSRGAKEKLSPYSITKLMTALLAVQSLPLDKTVTVSKEAASQKGSSMGLVQGEKVTVEQLLYGTFLVSGNDAAYALAEAVSGSKTKFVSKMNEMAKNLGCTKTRFVTPNGLPESGHYSTASDFLKITRVAFSNETIREIAGTSRYKMPKTNKHGARTLHNIAQILKTDGVVAAKTGFGSDSDCSIVCEYNSDGLKLFIVLIGDTKAERENDVRSLIDYSKKHIDGYRIVKQGKKVGKVHIHHGAKTSLDCYAAKDGYAYLPKEGSRDLVHVKAKIDDDVTAPVSNGDRVGTYEIYVGSDLINSVPIVVHESVAKGWFPSIFGISNTASVVILIILLILLGLFSWISHQRRKIRRQKMMARRRRLERLARERMMEEEDHEKRGWRF